MVDRNKERKTGAALDRPVSARARRKTNEEIASLAALQLKIHLASLQDKVFPADVETFKERLNRLTGSELAMLFAASRLLEGRCYSITSDNPETIRRHRSLAKHLRASIEESVAANKRSPGRRQARVL